MTLQKQEQQKKIDVVCPPPVTLVKLREHFKGKYKLTEPQVEIMVVSSSHSLKQSLADLAEVLSDMESIARLKAVYHGLKGLLLNMGEPEWAAYTKEIEQKLLVGEKLNHRMIAEMLRQGMAEVLAYGGKR